MASVQILPRIRVVSGRDIALGPGKAELLEHIVQTGCLRKAAATMQMSYMRAWMLVRTMNQCFKKPLVVLKRGGTKGGVTVVTREGRAVLALYRRMETQTLEASQAVRKQLSKYLR